jgi:hypothetical protein
MVAMTVRLAWWAMWRTKVMTSNDVTESSPDVGSSRNSKSGRLTISTPIDTYTHGSSSSSSQRASYTSQDTLAARYHRLGDRLDCFTIATTTTPLISASVAPSLPCLRA